MSSLLERVDRSIHARGLFRRGERILVAVSGGIDSMALLHLLHSLATRHRWRLTVAHFNHQLRGRSSDADERLVRRAAARLNVPVVAGRRNVRRLAREQGLSLEMAARQTRHDFLARTAARRTIRAIALAHHADDQVELFFVRLFRGSGGEGLSGMRWTAPSPGNAGKPGSNPKTGQGRAGLRARIVRPLLDLSKSELAGYASEHHIPFREDASNRRRDIQRNRIRHELLPLLRRKYQPAVERTVLRLMEIAGAEADFVGAKAREWLEGKSRERFDRLAVAVQRRCIQLQLLDRNVAADFDLVEGLRTAPGRRFAVGPGCAAVCDTEGGLSLTRSTEPQTRRSRIEMDLTDSGGEVEFSRVKIRWQIDACHSPMPPKSRAGRESFDADAVGPKVILRHWQPGDRFQPIGMARPVKLQDLFTNRKIPRAQRHELVVVAGHGGEIVWVEGLRISERFKLTRATNRRLQWRWKRV